MSDQIKEWPSHCGKPNSCGRNGMCVYGCGKHTPGDIAVGLAKAERMASANKLQAAYAAERQAHTKRIHDAYRAKAAALPVSAGREPVEWAEGAPVRVAHEGGYSAIVEGVGR